MPIASGASSSDALGRLRSCFRRASTKAIACTASGVVSEAVRPETAENRVGQRCLLLAPPQLHLQLHDRNRRSVGLPVAVGGAWRLPFWLLTPGFGHNDMFWYRLIERKPSLRTRMCTCGCSRQAASPYFSVKMAKSGTSGQVAETSSRIFTIDGCGKTVWWEPPSTTHPRGPRIWRRTSITPTGPARRATSRQPVGGGCVQGIAPDGRGQWRPSPGSLRCVRGQGHR